jgi:hypothetical protein
LTVAPSLVFSGTTPCVGFLRIANNSKVMREENAIAREHWSTGERLDTFLSEWQKWYRQAAEARVVHCLDGKIIKGDLATTSTTPATLI